MKKTMYVIGYKDCVAPTVKNLYEAKKDIKNWDSRAQIYKLVPVPTPKRHGMGRPGYERTAGTVKKGARREK